MKKTVFWVCSLFVLVNASAAPHWEYSGEEGPEHWAELTPEFAACAGKNQTPIDLHGFIDANLAPIVFNYKPGGQEVVNNGHTVQVNYAPGSTITVDGTVFELKQFHFHAPSENLIEGTVYPMEGHLVHVSEKGELAVIALMFSEGADHPVIEQAWAQLPEKAGKTARLEKPVNAETLLPVERDYYRFNGSLTTPPCTEGVRWLVMKHPVTVSKKEIEAFRMVMHHPNNRPLQAINAREILR